MPLPRQPNRKSWIISSMRTSTMRWRKSSLQSLNFPTRNFNSTNTRWPAFLLEPFACLCISNHKTLCRNASNA